MSKTFTNVLSNSRSTVTNAVSGMSSNYNLYIGLLIVIIVCVVIAYLLYIYVGYMLFSKFKTVIPDTKIPIIATTLTTIDATIDKTANGYRRSFTFWIYINDMNKYQGQYKHVLSLSNGTSTNFNPPLNCSPLIYLDRNNNAMFVRFTNLNSTTPDVTLPTDDASNLVFYTNQGVKIDYIPLQRWVHVAIVCNADKLGPSIYTYVDGEIVSSQGSSGLLNQSGISQNVNIDLNTSGTLYIGGSDTIVGKMPGFSGLVAKFTTYNYDINQQDVYNDYNNGPMSGFLAQLGLSSYGIRNPIYKI
jgi:hypothetical protein